MKYFYTDILKILKSKIVFSSTVLLLSVMIMDPISVLLINSQDRDFFNSIGSNAFQFWLLINSSSWGNSIYNSIMFIVPVLYSGLVFYNEQKSSYMTFLIIRDSKVKYFTAKACAVFVTTFGIFMFLFAINIVVTYSLFPSNAPKTEQYMYIEPMKNMFSYDVYMRNPLLFVILYMFLNALVIALYSVMITGIHSIMKTRNNYYALLIPYLILYMINFSKSIVFRKHLNWNLRVIIQPRAASSLTETISLGNVIATVIAEIIIDILLIFIGYYRNKDVL